MQLFCQIVKTVKSQQHYVTDVALSLLVKFKMTRICPERIIGNPRNAEPFRWGLICLLHTAVQQEYVAWKQLSCQRYVTERRLGAHPKLAQVALDLEMDGEESVFYRQLPKVVSLKYMYKETRLVWRRFKDFECSLKM